MRAVGVHRDVIVVTSRVWQTTCTAVRAGSETLVIDPEFADAWYNLALLKEAAGDKQGARLCLERAIAADPDYADPVYNLAKLQFELGCFAEASRLWQRYLALDPDSEWSRRARSGLHLCEQHSRPGTG